ncbi:MAG TPA: glycosyltransferase family 2 protein [Xanthomonadales bacterium]|nr:glycosyltransferase family 2 protein [Xanthomonadales bacterium]
MRPRLTVIVPCFNEEATLPLLHPRLGAVLDALDADARVLYVDDGSRDRTVELIEAIASQDPRVALLRLSRNFGKEIAMSAGLDHADADAVVLIDADLQDPPELIPELVAKHREGYDVVYAVRRSRAGESWLKRATATAFYRVIGSLSRTPVPQDTGDFRLLSRRAVEALRQVREQHRFMKGLFGWVGFRQVGVAYDRAPRAAGDTKWNYWKLWNFAIEGITSFTSAPLRVATYVGLASAAFAFLYAIVVIVKTMLYGDPVAGYPSLMVVMLFLGGIQLMALGLIGEYLGRLYVEAKRRPLYLVDRYEAPRADRGG